VSGGVLETRQELASLRTEFQSGDELTVEFARNFEFLPGPFRVAGGRTVPPGRYRFQEFSARFQAVPALGELEDLLKSRLHQEPLNWLCPRLTRALGWFERIREDLRVSRNPLAEREVPEAAPVAEVRRRLEESCREIRAEGQRLGGEYPGMAETLCGYTERHMDRLLRLVVGKDGVELVFSRVNNPVEGARRWCRMNIRRRTGRGRTAREMAQHGPLLAVFSNLTNPTYAREVLAGIPSLARALQEIPEKEVTELRALLHRAGRPRGLPVTDGERPARLQEFVELVTDPEGATRVALEGWLSRVSGLILAEV
jgi:hypothetical protein